MTNTNAGCSPYAQKFQHLRDFFLLTLDRPIKQRIKHVNPTTTTVSSQVRSIQSGSSPLVAGAMVNVNSCFLLFFYKLDAFFSSFGWLQAALAFTVNQVKKRKRSDGRWIFFMEGDRIALSFVRVDIFLKRRQMADLSQLASRRTNGWRDDTSQTSIPIAIQILGVIHVL